MAISRQDALKRLNGLAPRVQEHLQKLAEHPESWDASHWKQEAASWLDQMEAVLPHVGKKTGSTGPSKSLQWRNELEK
jgi:hypothetical protein